MLLLSKNELNELLGEKSTWFPESLLAKLSYASGIPEFDIIMEGRTVWDAAAFVNIHKRPLGFQVEIVNNFKWSSVAIPFDLIREIHLEDKEQIIEKKEKSVIGRALVGGFLLGPVGAIIGGMSGIGTKDTLAQMPELAVTFLLRASEMDQVVVFFCKYKHRKDVDSFLKKHCPEKYVIDAN